MSRRREPDARDEEDERNGFFDTPLGWLLSVVAVAAYVVVFVLSELAALVIATVLLVAETLVQLKKDRPPWLVEARASGSQRDLTWRVAGRRRSRRVVEEVAEGLERGHTELVPPGTERL